MLREKEQPNKFFAQAATAEISGGVGEELHGAASDKGVSENKRACYYRESLGRDGVNLLRKAAGQLTERSFNTFAKVL